LSSLNLAWVRLQFNTGKRGRTWGRAVAYIKRPGRLKAARATSEAARLGSQRSAPWQCGKHNPCHPDDAERNHERRTPGRFRGQDHSFRGKRIRRTWHQEQWYFSVVDIMAALTDSENPRDYWYRMKQRELEASGIELSTFCRQLKLASSDGKSYQTDCDRGARRSKTCTDSVPKSPSERERKPAM
jgi:hypothetical protein